MDEFSHRLLAEHHILAREAHLETTTAAVVVADSEDRGVVRVAVVVDQWVVLLPEIGDEARDLITAVEVEVASGVAEDVTSGFLRTQLESCLVVHVTKMCKVAPCSRYRAYEFALPLKPDFQATAGTKPHRMCMTETSAWKAAENSRHFSWFPVAATWDFAPPAISTRRSSVQKKKSPTYQGDASTLVVSITGPKAQVNWPSKHLTEPRFETATTKS
jgi:hypothetical protein